MLYIVLFLCTFGVLYFSWISNPRFDEETYIPLWIREWSNKNYNLRTAVPFVVIGFLLGFIHYKNKQRKDDSDCIKTVLVNLSISAGIVCLAEGGQFLIKSRNPDLMDVFYGITGALLGSIMYYVVYKAINHLKKTSF